MTGPARAPGRRGRPVIFDEARRDAFLDAMKAGATQAKAAAAVGISTRAVRHHAQHHTDFATALAAAREAGRWADKPHDAYRYRHQGCRCDLCTAAATTGRAGRARTPRTTRPQPQQDAQIIQLTTTGTPVPLLKAVV
jgi:hypothetical protein